MLLEGDQVGCNLLQERRHSGLRPLPQVSAWPLGHPLKSHSTLHSSSSSGNVAQYLDPARPTALPSIPGCSVSGKSLTFSSFLLSQPAGRVQGLCHPFFTRHSYFTLAKSHFCAISWLKKCQWFGTARNSRLLNLKPRFFQTKDLHSHYFPELHLSFHGQTGPPTPLNVPWAATS